MDAEYYPRYPWPPISSMSGLVTVDDLDFDRIHYYNVDENSIWRTYNLQNVPDVWRGEVREGPCTGLSATFTFWGASHSIVQVTQDVCKSERLTIPPRYASDSVRARRACVKR